MKNTKYYYTIYPIIILLTVLFMARCGGGSCSNSDKQADKNIEVSKDINVGQVLPIFTQNTPEGKPLSLESLRGEVVLVNFWASWCGPCRRHNPELVQAYNLFKDQGFTILGVSLDRDKNKWVEAIEKDNLTWHHVSDLKFWDNDVAVKFGIRSTPSNFLLNKEGVIVAKNIYGQELIDEIKNLL